MKEKHLTTPSITAAMGAAGICCVAVAVFFMTAGPAISDSGPPADAVARVNDQYISRSDLGRALMHSIGPEVMGRFVKIKLIEAEAGLRVITITDPELRERVELQVQMQLEDIYEHNRVTREEFAGRARSDGFELEDLEKRIRDSVCEQDIRTRLKVEKILRDRVAVGENEIEQLFRWRYGRRISAEHIVVPQREQALQLYAHLQLNPGDWAAAVQEVSADRRSVEFNGRLLPFPADTELGKAFEDRRPGEMFLHETERGWHVLRLLNVFQEVQDLAPEDVAERFKNEIVARRIENMLPGWLAELRSQASVRMPEEGEEDALLYLNGRPVAVSEFEKLLVDLFGMMYLDRVVERRLIGQQAARRNISISHEAIDDRLERLAEMLFLADALDGDGGVAELEERLMSEGISSRFYRDYLQERLLHPEGVRAMLEAERIVALTATGDGADKERAESLRRGPRAVVQRFRCSSREDARYFLETAVEQGGLSRLILLESDDPLAWLACGIIRDVTPGERYYEKVEGLSPGRFSGVFEEAGGFVFLRLLEISEGGGSQGKEGDALDWYRMREGRRALPALVEKLFIEAEFEIYR